MHFLYRCCQENDCGEILTKVYNHYTLKASICSYNFSIIAIYRNLKLFKYTLFIYSIIPCLP